MFTSLVTTWELEDDTSIDGIQGLAPWRFLGVIGDINIQKIQKYIYANINIYIYIRYIKV